MVDLFKVGVITSTHGIKGEVKVFPTTDDSMRFKKCKELIVNYQKEQCTLKVENVKFFKNMVIIKFEGINNINDVEKYKGSELFVTRKNAVKLSKDEYFIADLIGLKVIEEDEKELGILTDVMETGANDVYVVQMKENEELLLPAIKECILEVNIEEGYIRVHVMEGLL